MEDNKFGFSAAEWETCLKVLETLKNTPENNPDNQTFKTLIAKIKKNARKNLRKVSYQEKRSEDLNVQLQTKIVKAALTGETTYTAAEKEETKFTPLNLPKNCYCCNNSYELVHSFYNRMCPNCATINYEKRFQAFDLTGQVALLTGCRVKVGYATALKLLRAGATVIGTTRLPALALEQFKKEADYPKWSKQLTIYGLDLRDLKKMEQFVAFIKDNYVSLSIIINNAAQTIKYPESYYLPLVAAEKNLLLSNSTPNQLYPNKTELVSHIQQLDIPTSLGKETVDLTRFGQPIDNRAKTSWNSTLTEVSMVELLEVNLINQIAPYFIIKALKPLLLRSENKMRHIINVTSSEGMFSYANKTIFHPHTNMTKASLNMLTRTSGKEFSDDAIYMNSVDVGWISTGAVETLRKKQFEKAYVPPLDSVDGASRILDPIYEAINNDGGIFGKLLKDYEIHPW